MKFDFKKLLPHIIAVVAFLIVSVFYCKPTLEGKVVSQSDMVQWKGMSKDAENYKERHGVYPEWTNGMFSGMPSFAIAFQNNAGTAGLVPYITGFMLPVPILYFFLACICFYFLSQVLRINPYIGMLGAFAFAFASYDPILVSAGHHTKLITIAQMPALLGALLLTYRKKYWLGGALTAWFTAGLISHSHLQMVYYCLLIVLFMTLAYVIYWVRSGQVKHLFVAGVISLVAAGLGVLANTVTLLPTNEYAKYTIRGGTALAGNGTNSSKVGLDTGYAFQYSYAIPETFSFLVPNIYGGESRPFGEGSKLYSTIAESGLQQQTAELVMRRLKEYWGNQPGTGGPVYLGAIICFLVVLSYVSLRSKQKWWILAASLFAILLAWGNNLPGINTFLFEHLPLYNKFRAPTQSLVIPQLLFPLLAAMGLQQFIFGKDDEKLQWKQVLLSGGIAAGVFVLILILAQLVDYKVGYEDEFVRQISQQSGNPSIGREILNAAVDSRKALLMADFWRSFIFVAIAFGVVALFVKRKISPIVAVLVLLLLSSADVISEGRRYLNDDSFVEKEDADVEGTVANYYPASLQAYQQILNGDKDPHYRVYNIGGGDPYNDALTSYYLRSVGGYHPAKLSIYQDLIENQLGKGNMPSFNMLDTKYFIGQDGQPQLNPGAMGAAWFVKAIRYVDGPVAEMKALDSLNVRDTAIIDKQFQPQVTLTPQADSAASIQLTKYDNDEIEYSLKTGTNQLAVLSEIYYPAGWKAYVDGKETPIVKANYVLRAVNIPTNAKKLELKFVPEVYLKSYKITGIMNWLLYIILFAGLFMSWWEWQKRHPQQPSIKS